MGAGRTLGSRQVPSEHSFLADCAVFIACRCRLSSLEVFERPMVGLQGHGLLAPAERIVQQRGIELGILVPLRSAPRVGFHFLVYETQFTLWTHGVLLP